MAANSQELLDMVRSERITVTNKEDGTKVDIGSGQDAFYALLAQDMIDLASQYGKEIMDVHETFYQVSCNRDSLVAIL